MTAVGPVPRRRDTPPERRRGRAGRTLLVAGISLALVVAIALVAAALTKSDDNPGGAEIPSLPSLAPASDSVQPSEEDWEALLPRLQEAVDATPDDVNAQRKLALAYHNLGYLKEAAALYERLLATEEDAVLRTRLGNVLRDQGDYAGAEAAYRRAIIDDPTLAAPYLNLAEILWRQGLDDEALAVLEEGLLTVPEESRGPLEEGRQAIHSAGE